MNFAWVHNSKEQSNKYVHDNETCRVKTFSFSYKQLFTSFEIVIIS